MYTTGTADGSLFGWKIGSYDLIFEIPFAHKRMITGLIITKDNSLLASSGGDTDALIKFWSVLQLQQSEDELDSHHHPMKVIEGHRKSVSG